MSKAEQVLLNKQEAVRLYSKFSGNTNAVAKAMGVSRSTAWNRLKSAGALEKPLAGGTLGGTKEEPLKLPKKGKIKRYFLTACQNNTLIHENLWKNLLALKEYYDAELLIGTFSYNKNAYGQLAVKRGSLKKSDHERELWYDDRIEPYICDRRKVIGDGLVWAGECNIIPTATNPLSGFEVYTQKHSSIFPHVKLAMRSVATMKNGNGAKLMYTTGAISLRNYIQKKAGQLAEYHHTFAALIVEVNSDGDWFVRQINAESSGRIQDLDIVVEDGEVTTGNPVEGINYGDIHASLSDPDVTAANIEMLDTLKPKYQLFHDIMSGESTNPHGVNDPHAKYRSFVRGYSSVQSELDITAKRLKEYDRPWSQGVVIGSNHDSPWIERWLKGDYRNDPLNARLFLELQLAIYTAIEETDNKFNLIECAMRRCKDCPKTLRFLREDESFLIANRQIECGMHGHLGVNGSKGSPNNLKNIGKKCNVGHYHAACIVDGLYAAGTSTQLDLFYNKGPSSWSHSNILTYPSGKRSLITIFDGKWRA